MVGGTVQTTRKTTHYCMCSIRLDSNIESAVITSRGIDRDYGHKAEKHPESKIMNRLLIQKNYTVLRAVRGTRHVARAIPSQAKYHVILLLQNTSKRAQIL